MSQSAAIGRRQLEAALADSRGGPLWAPRLAALAGLAAGWIAAGSTGLLGSPLRRGLTWVALGLVLLLARPGARRLLDWLWLAAAVILAIPMIASSLPAINVWAVALVLAAVAAGWSGPGRMAILLAAEAVALLGAFRLAYSSIGWFWLVCDRLASASGAAVGWMTGQALRIGPSFAGLDFLVVMVFVAIRGPLAVPGTRSGSPGRTRGVALAIGAVLIGHVLYLSGLSLIRYFPERKPESEAVPAWRRLPGEPEQPGRQEGRRQWGWQTALHHLVPALLVGGASAGGRAAFGSAASWGASLPKRSEPAPWVWNLPLVALIVHVAIGWMILRVLLGLPEPADNPGPWTRAPPGHPELLTAAALVLAVAAPAVLTLWWHYPDLSGKKVVFFEKGRSNWFRPTYPPPGKHRWDSAYYGWLSSGMYGMLPTYLESLGASTLISPDLSEGDLAGADVLVLLYPREPWQKGQLERIRRFVQQGGTLLVAGDHTAHEPLDPRGKLAAALLRGAISAAAVPTCTLGAGARVHKPLNPEDRLLSEPELAILRRGDTEPLPAGTTRINELLEPTGIRVPFDSAMFALTAWLDCYETISHPTSAGIAGGRGNLYGVVTGASVEVRWPAMPLLIGRWGWSDQGFAGAPIEKAMLGNRAYDPGERLGDVVLAAEQRLGAGRVIVFGDTTSFVNGVTVSCHPYTSRLFAYLAEPGVWPRAAWRQGLGTGLLAALLAVLIGWSSPGRLAAVALALGASLAASDGLTFRAWTVLPDGNLKRPNNLAYIDESHLNRFSWEGWRSDGIMPLAATLMRNDFLSLMLPEITPERLQGARLLVVIAPAKPYTRRQRQTIRQFVDQGGILILTVGHEKAGPSRALLEEFLLYVGGHPEDLKALLGEPKPLGHVKTPYFRGTDYSAAVRFFAGWPIDAWHRYSLFLSHYGYQYAPYPLPTIVIRRHGEGIVALVGDSDFALAKNLEYEDGSLIEGMRENADFWRYFISLLRDGVGEGPIWFPPKPVPLSKTGQPESTQPDQDEGEAQGPGGPEAAPAEPSPDEQMPAEPPPEKGGPSKQSSAKQAPAQQSAKTQALDAPPPQPD
ncbi:MAG: hypothetical protein ACUVUC_02900 [Thermoguttaceae bacterium]